MAWKLSVLEYFYMPSRKHFYSTINGSHSAGVGSISYNVGGAQFCFLKGDIIRLGPSTHTNNPGKYEFARVSSVSSSAFTLMANTTYAYANTDPVEGVSTGLSDEWTLTKTGTYDIKLLGLSSKFGASGNALFGFNQKLGATWIDMVTAGGVSDELKIRTNDFKRQLLRDTPYRLGGYLLQTGLIAGTIGQYRLWQGDSDLIFLNIQQEMSSFTKKEAVVTSGAVLTGFPYIYFFWFGGCGFDLFAFDSLYLTHACMSSGRGAGVYSFPVDPIQVTEFESDVQKYVTTQYDNIYNIGPLLSTSNRGWELQFEDVDINFVRELEVFNYWQNIGYMLMLESDISNAPPLFGFMESPDIRFSEWNDRKMDLRLVFHGV